MAEVFLRRLTRWQAETQRESVADLYVAAHDGPPAGGDPEREAFLRRFAGYDVQRPGFEMVIGSDPALAGCCYGYPADREGEWCRALPGEAPAALREHAAAGRLFLIAELMVLPAYRRTRVATRLQETLLIRSNAAQAVVFLAPGNEPAHAAFRSWGWRPAGWPEPGAATPGSRERQAWSRALA
ncbi:GNAT family N-acetyltransferase [Streptomyces sp. NPDC091266]|uniref:GNAT family N-acetyltransferase n=1 Tax=Streptomyces sp. NPDC091266 TaxID=3365978 RepID=UPI003813C110